MEKTGRVGIASVVMFNKEYLAALRPLEGNLCLETMHFNDELLSADTITGMDAKTKVDDRELKVAQQLIDSLTTKFDPKKYHDEYREKVMTIIDKKAHGEAIVQRPPEEERPRKGSDLIAALEASLAKRAATVRRDQIMAEVLVAFPAGEGSRHERGQPGSFLEGGPAAVERVEPGQTAVSQRVHQGAGGGILRPHRTDDAAAFEGTGDHAQAISERNGCGHFSSRNDAHRTGRIGCAPPRFMGEATRSL